jgi:hypothetical protein
MKDVSSQFGQVVIGRTLALTVALWSCCTPAAASASPKVVIIEGGESSVAPDECRGIIVGPGVNQPDPFPGYAGFVGWESPIRLSTGEWIVGFNAGYWHASPPTPLEYPTKTLESYLQMGMPAQVDAPTGGRVMLTRSRDEGQTWSKPETLIDTPADDRHPAFVELNDGTILCSFFTYASTPAGGVMGKEPAARVHIVRSFDAGRTWEKNSRQIHTPFHYDETDGPFLELDDGSVALAVNGRFDAGPPDRCGIVRSADRGESWQLL